jgi:hypothetical protein
MVLHVPSGTYLRVDRAGAEILDLLADGRSSAVGGLTERYGIPPEQAERDVDAVVTALIRLRRSPARPVRRPTASGVARIARAWRALPGPLRSRVLRLSGRLTGVEVGIRILDLGRLARWARCPLETDQAALPLPPLALDALDPVERTGLQAVDWLLAHWVADGTCLRRALLAAQVLRRRRPRLRLGLMPDEATAHAWIETDAGSLGAGPAAAVFTIPSSGVTPAR